MTNEFGEQSPEQSAPCAGGFCGRIDYDYVFKKTEEEIDEKLDNEASFDRLLSQAVETINQGKLGFGLSCFRQAYEIAWETESLGIDACFDVMFQVHYFAFHEDAIRMCAEIAEKALRTQDVSILQDLWRLLPEIGSGSDVHEASLQLRDDIETRHPEVMTYIEKSSRL